MTTRCYLTPVRMAIAFLKKVADGMKNGIRAFLVEMSTGLAYMETA